MGGGVRRTYLPDFQWTVLIASDELIKNEPNLLRAVLRAYSRTARAASNNPEEYIAFTAELFKLPPNVVRRSVMREISHYELACRLDWSGFQRAIELQMSLGALQQRVEAADVVDLRFIPELEAATS